MGAKTIRQHWSINIDLKEGWQYYSFKFLLGLLVRTIIPIGFFFLVKSWVGFENMMIISLCLLTVYVAELGTKKGIAR